MNLQFELFLVLLSDQNLPEICSTLDQQINGWVLRHNHHKMCCTIYLLQSRCSMKYDSSRSNIVMDLACFGCSILQSQIQLFPSQSPHDAIRQKHLLISNKNSFSTLETFQKLQPDASLIRGKIVNSFKVIKVVWGGLWIWIWQNSTGWVSCCYRTFLHKVQKSVSKQNGFCKWMTLHQNWPPETLFYSKTGKLRTNMGGSDNIR